MEEEIAARLESLERRLAALEGRTAPPPPATEDAFWALGHLQAQGVQGVMYAGQVTASSGVVEWQYGLGTDILLGQDWDDAAPVLAALGHPSRLRLLRAILRGVTRTADLSALEDMGTTGPLYHHLRELVAAGWLRPAGRGEHLSLIHI